MKKCSPEFLGISATVLFFGAAFSMSCKLSAMPTQAIGKTAAGVALGESRIAFGQYFRRMTNLYNHRGFEARNKAAFDNSVFQKWREHASPQEHLHLEGVDAKEMLPWLWLAIKMDPHNVENYLVAAFSVATSVKKPEIAHQILLEAQRKNPFNYQVQLEDAIIFVREENYIQAMRRLNSGLVLWPSDIDPKSDQAIFEKIYLLSYKALIHEASGEPKKAIGAFKQILELQPGDKELENRIAILERGIDTSTKAKEVLKALVKISDDNKSSCSYGEQKENEGHTCSAGCKHN